MATPYVAVSMILLHRIGSRINSNFNTMDEILTCDEPLSFDGIYREIWEPAKWLGPFRRKDVTLFVMGKFVGDTNRFDPGQPFGEYLTWPEILDLAKMNGWKVGYHSWSHQDLTTLTDAEVIREIMPPFPMERFAYPGGAVDARVAKLVEQAGYKEAWSVTQGDGSQFQRRRRYLNW